MGKALKKAFQIFICHLLQKDYYIKQKNYQNGLKQFGQFLMQLKKRKSTIKDRHYLGYFELLKNQKSGSKEARNGYVGYDTRTDEKVALHFRNPLELAHWDIDREIELLKYLTSKPSYIVKFHDFLPSQGGAWLATELCQNGSLQDKIKLQEMGSAEVAKYVVHILSGYKKVFQADVIHRNLKPSSIFITSSDEAKIGSFEYAIFQSDLQKQQSYSVGSVEYMAPEVLSSSDYSPKSDIWALGVIFYQMLNGKLPWEGHTKKSLYEKIRKSPFEQSLNLHQTQLSGIMNQLISEMLEVNPDNRINGKSLFKYTEKISHLCEVKYKRKESLDYMQQITKRLILIVDYVRLHYYLLKIIKIEQKRYRGMGKSFLKNQKICKKMKQQLSLSMFEELNNIQKLTYLDKAEKEQYKYSEEFLKVTDIVQGYRKKYEEYLCMNPTDYHGNPVQQMLRQCHQNITTQSPYTLLLFYDYLTVLFVIRKQLSRNGNSIKWLVKNCYTSSILNKLKKAVMNIERIRNKPIKEKHIKKLEERLVDIQVIFVSKSNSGKK